MDKRKKTKILILIGLILLGIGVGLVVYRLRGDTVPVSETDSDGVPIAVFIPTWTAMIPILAANKDKEKELSKKEKGLALFFAIAAGVVIVGSILYLLFR